MNADAIRAYTSGVLRSRATYQTENVSDEDRAARKKAKHAYDQRRYQARKESKP